MKRAEGKEVHVLDIVSLQLYMIKFSTFFKKANNFQGTGTGLLSMMAAKLGADSITAGICTS